MTTDLAKQITQEAQEIAQAPVVQLGAAAQRCHFCGQLTDGGTEIFGPAHSAQESQMRFKGRCCGGCL